MIDVLLLLLLLLLLPLLLRSYSRYIHPSLRPKYVM